MSLDRDLRHLLHCHDCVIVPQWGGFITQYRSAWLDEARKLVHPPGKDVSFNRNLVRNDGLLADHLARQSGITFSAANAQIEGEVARWRSILVRDGRLELPHVGIFYRDMEQILQFEPDRRANFLRDAHGLRPVAAVSVERVRPAPLPKPEPKVIPLPLPQVQAPGPRRRIAALWPVAAGLAALVAVGAWYINQNQDGRVQWSELNPFGPRSQRTYIPAPPPPDQVVSSAGIFVLPENGTGLRELPLTINDSVTVVVDLGAPAPSEAAKPDTTHVAVRKPLPAPPVPAERSRFHVIGGCFAQPENAERFLLELRGKGFDAAQLPLYGELHPVAYGSYARRQEALEALASVRSSAQSSAWLLVR